MKFYIFFLNCIELEYSAALRCIILKKVELLCNITSITFFLLAYLWPLAPLCSTFAYG